MLGVDSLDDAVRFIHIACPTCHAADVPGTLPVLRRDPGGRLTCLRCQRNFQPFSYGYLKTLRELALAAEQDPPCSTDPPVSS